MRAALNSQMHALLLALVLLQEDDGVVLEEAPVDLVAKLRRYAEARDWKGMLQIHREAVAKHRTKVVRDPDRAVWHAVPFALAREIARHRGGLEAYRLEYEGRADMGWKRAKALGDRAAMLRIVDEHSLCETASRILDELGTAYWEEAQHEEAVHCWRRLLESGRDLPVPAHVIAARLAAAAEAWGSESALAWVREHVARHLIDGPIRAGDESTTLVEWLASLQDPPAPTAKEPPLAVGAPDATLDVVRPDVRRWSMPIGDGRTGLDVPFLAAHVRHGGRDFVLVCSGRQVTAFDPTRADDRDANACVFWRWPQDPLPAPVRPAAFARPLIGVTPDGDAAFAIMNSTKKVPVAPARAPFPAACQLACLALGDGSRRWSTDDDALHEAWTKLEFYERDWSFSAPPLVAGDRVYLGVGSSPLAGAESHVVCADRETGRPLWARCLGAAAGGGRQAQPMLTMLAWEGGIVYAHSNVGVVAALHGVTGDIAWLSRYPRVTGRGVGSLRPASPVFVHGGRVYVLPQDQWEWQAFDASSGERLDAGAPGVDWRSMQQLVGIADGMAMLAGTPSVMVRLSDGKKFDLVHADVARGCRAALMGDTLYVPTAGELSTFCRRTGWKYEGTPWPTADAGHVLLVGGHVVAANAQRVAVFADRVAIDRRYRARLSQSAPDPDVLLEHAELMRRSGLEREAFASYRAFVDAASGDPARRTQLDAAKRHVAELRRKLGEREEY